MQEVNGYVKCKICGCSTQPEQRATWYRLEYEWKPNRNSGQMHTCWLCLECVGELAHMLNPLRRLIVDGT